MAAKIERTNQAAFTLVEIMIVVAIIGLLAALAVPSFVKNRKQSQGRRIVSDARAMDTAIDRWALDTDKEDGDPVDSAEVSSYMKDAVWRTVDLLGNSYVFGTVGTGQVTISSTTKAALANCGIDWSSY